MVFGKSQSDNKWTGEREQDRERANITSNKLIKCNLYRFNVRNKIPYTNTELICETDGSEKGSILDKSSSRATTATTATTKELHIYPFVENVHLVFLVLTHISQFYKFIRFRKHSVEPKFYRQKSTYTQNQTLILNHIYWCSQSSIMFMPNRCALRKCGCIVYIRVLPPPTLHNLVNSECCQETPNNT